MLTYLVPTSAAVISISSGEGAGSIATNQGGGTLSSTTLVVVAKYAVCSRLTHCPSQVGSWLALHMHSPFVQVASPGHYERELLSIETLRNIKVRPNSQCSRKCHSWDCSGGRCRLHCNRTCRTHTIEHHFSCRHKICSLWPSYT